MATVPYLDDLDQLETTAHTCRIENFSKLEESEFYSDTFLAGGRKWRILVHPKETDSNFLQVFMNLADSETDPRIVPALISLTVVNQQNSDLSVEVDSTSNFRQFADNIGFSTVPHADLRPKGFIVNDTLIVEAEVTPLDLPANANGNTGSYFSQRNVQRACKMIEGEIFDVIGRSDCPTLQQKKEKLAGFFNMSVESLCQTRFNGESL